MKTNYATNIIWDCDGDAVSLPTEIRLPDGMVDEKEISDFISNVTGYQHRGFCVVVRDEGANIPHMIENIQKVLRSEEEYCNDLQKSLIDRVKASTVEELAHGRLDGILNDIGRSVEKMRGLREQIEVLELVLSKA